jgi:hypothetical protein
MVTSKHGMALQIVHIPRSTTRGQHTIVVRGPDGSFGEDTVRVR